MLSPLARQIVALGLALGAVALALAYPVRGYVQQQQAERQAVAEQQELEDQVTQLNSELAALQDPAYVRQQAKRRLQYVTPGDTVYVVKVPPAMLGDDQDAPADGRVPATEAGAASSAAPAPGEGERVDDVDSADDQPWYGPLWATLTGS